MLCRTVGAVPLMKAFCTSSASVVGEQLKGLSSLLTVFQGNKLCYGLRPLEPLSLTAIRSSTRSTFYELQLVNQL